MPMERIRDAMTRGRQVLQMKPERGRRTITSRVRMGDGLQCTVEDGDWRLAVDMSVNTGGAGSAPDPGVYARAALGTCLAIAYRMWAAADGIVLDAVDVEVHADNDAAGLFGAADVPPGYRAVRLSARVVSSADAARLRRVLDAAEAHSPYLDVFRRPVPVAVSREIVTSAGIATSPEGAVAS
jgi:uncharacterized OsmC-like protein